MKNGNVRSSKMSLGLILAMLIVSGASTAWAEAEWFPLDTLPPGSPVDFIINPDISDPLRTVITLKIHGFYVEDKSIPGGPNFHQITVPGMGSLNQPGAPDLPAFKCRLGLVSGALRAVLAGSEIHDESFFDVFYDIRPQMLEEMEPIEGNLPERFIIDEQIYAGETFWPGMPGTGSDGLASSRGIPTADVTMLPFQWNPGTGILSVASEVTYVFEHTGDPQPLGPFTRDSYQYLESVLINFDAIDDLLIVGWWNYNSDYLIVTPEEYRDTLDAFINLKRSQGYFVSVRYVENIGSDCDLIRDAIEDWYDDAPTNRDKYCLLVGDVNVIPTCTSPYLNTDWPDGVPTDDLYGSVNGDDLDEEVYVGRLSVDDEADLAQQLDRIIDYQTGAHLLENYSAAALVAHKEDAPGKYTEAHESVRTALYSDAPSFETFYGYLGATNNDVSDGIDIGFGVVAYRGHGSSSAWTGWNISGESYNDSDIGGLSNAIHPVIWSFACTNARLSSSDCVGEKWMEYGDHGAISHYGSTVASYTSQNHDLDRQMFQAVYDEGLTIQAQAIEFGEEMMGVLNGDHNAWMYLLLGDPSMRIRTHGNLVMEWAIPEYIEFEPGIPVNFPLQISENGFPLSDVLFAVYKPMSGREEGEEVFDNTYTNILGQAALTIMPESEGWLYYTLRDNNGQAVYDSIEVRSLPTDAPDFGSSDLHFWADPSVVSQGSTLRFSRNLNRESVIEIYQVSGRRVRRLEVNGEQDSVAWDGRDEKNRSVPGGVYFARIKTGGMQYTTRLVVLH